jgi:hypothetical protein
MEAAMFRVDAPTLTTDKSDAPAAKDQPAPRWSAWLVARLDPPHDFNFRHFRMRHMAAELLRTVRADGVPPGCEAPDFDLETTDGGRLRLRDLRGRPVLLHFGSYSCPLTRGGVLPMRELYRRYGDRVQFVDVIVRQAHPGERRGAYHSYAEKLEDARRYRQEEAVAWPVVVDDLAATVQRAYGGLSASVYLIDSAGRVAFYGMWGQALPLTTAIDDLLARGGTGAPAGQGLDRVPHLGAAIVAGRGGPARGGRVALLDLELGFPCANVLMAVGHLGRPLLGPLVLRTTPLPVPARVALRAGFAGGIAALVWVIRRRREPGRRARSAVGSRRTTKRWTTQIPATARWMRTRAGLACAGTRAAVPRQVG